MKTKKGKISECAGLWSSLNDKQVSGMKKSISVLRKSTMDSMNKYRYSRIKGLNIETY